MRFSYVSTFENVNIDVSSSTTLTTSWDSCKIKKKKSIQKLLIEWDSNPRSLACRAMALTLRNIDIPRENHSCSLQRPEKKWVPCLMVLLD